MTCGIYKITNTVNGKCYIGQSLNIEKRWQRHRSDQSGRQPKLHAAMKKYGIEAFAFEVIETCKPEHLDAFEEVYIRTFKAADAGYNVERHPRGTGSLSDETRRRISKSKTGKKRGPPTDETRQKMKEAMARAAVRGDAARRRYYISVGMTEEEADEAMRKHAEKRARAAYLKTPAGMAERRERMRAAARAAWTPERREKARIEALARWTPERREKARIEALARWDAMTEEEKRRFTKSPRT